MKTREEWEQELRDRQAHNYVFPGTVINQTAMYREMLRGTFPLSTFQRVAMFVLGFLQIFLGLYFAVVAVSAFAHEPDLGSRVSESTLALLSLPVFALGIKMAIRAISFPPKMSRQDNDPRRARR